MNMVVEWVIVALALFVLQNLYFLVAKRFNILDRPNQRSSHKEPTVRGGGVVFVFAILYYLLIYEESSYSLIFAILLLAIFSFWDDIKSLPSKGRLLAQIIAGLLLFYHLQVFEEGLLLAIILLIVVIGFINVYNFMDGINGLTVVYSFAVLGSLFFLNQRENLFQVEAFVYPTAALVVFGFYNVRRKAKSFSGDVGSVVMGTYLAYLLFSFALELRSIYPMLFVSVYGIDSVYTILIRLRRRENILEAHRLHLYQLMANEKGLSHLKVSFGYLIAQVVTSVITLILWRTSIISDWYVAIIVLSVLSIIYWVIRLRIDQKFEFVHNK